MNLDLDNVLFSTHIELQILKQYENEVSEIFEEILILLSDALNDFHGVTYSLKFWRIILSSWLNYTISLLHYYYSKVIKLDDILKEEYIVVSSFPFRFMKMSDMNTNLANSNLIHTFLSFVLQQIKPNQIRLDNATFSPKYNRIKRKRNLFIEPLRSLFFRFLNFGENQSIIYGMSGVSYSDMIKIKFRDPNIGFRFKDEFELASNTKKQVCIKLNNKNLNKLERIIVEFIENFLPYSLLEGFSPLIQQSTDLQNTKLFVASAGFFKDEQLFEIALNTEKYGGKVAQSQEGGEGYSYAYSSSKIFYEPSDYYLTWGWEEHNNYNTCFIPIKSPKLSKLVGKYKPKYQKILYLTKFAYIYPTLYNSNFIRNFSEYNQNKIDFCHTLVAKGLSKKLLVKLHESKYKGFNEHKFFKKQLPCIDVYDNKEINIKNVGMLYIDYFSAAMYEAMVLNIPTIFCFNPKVMLCDKYIDYYIREFKRIGIAFDSPVDAANKIAEVYPKREKFWNQKEVQKVRQDFLNAYCNTDPNWHNSLIQRLGEL